MENKVKYISKINGTETIVPLDEAIAILKGYHALSDNEIIKALENGGLQTHFRTYQIV